MFLVKSDLFEFNKLTIDKFKLLLADLYTNQPALQPYRAIILKESEVDNANMMKVRDLCCAHAEQLVKTRIETTVPQLPLEVNAVRQQNLRNQKKKRGPIRECYRCRTTVFQVFYLTVIYYFIAIRIGWEGFLLGCRFHSWLKWRVIVV